MATNIAHPHGHLEYRIAPGDTCEIVDIHVDGEHRREGVGRRMVEMLWSCIPAKTQLIYAFTGEDNRIAHDFYHGTGFVLMAKLKGFYGDRDARLYGRHRDVR